jgi:hypothetical protein
VIAEGWRDGWLRGWLSWSRGYEKQQQHKPRQPTESNPTRRARQAKKPDERTDETGYQKLPHDYRPLAGRAQRDPLDYDSHTYPSMLRFARHLALCFDAPRTRHSYYRQKRLVHEQAGCDPAEMTALIFTIRMTNGFFRSNGQGDGGSRPSHGNRWDLPMFCPARADSTPGNRSESIPGGANRPD